MKKKRYFFLKIKWKIDAAFSAISCWFNPRQGWLTSKIPNSWCDKPELVQILLFEILVNFVEDEKGLSQAAYDWNRDISEGYVTQEYVDEVLSTCVELQSVYDYIKNIRPVLEKSYYDSMPEFCHIELGEWKIKSGTINSDFKKSLEIEDEINAKDLHALQTIVKHYKYLWT